MNGSAARDGAGIVRIDSDYPPAAGLTPLEVGGKAAGLLRMTAAGIRVPPGFVLGTDCSRDYYRNGRTLTGELAEEIQRHVRLLETGTPKGFGSRRNPLLLSVRSGAPASMPGMMETLLNIGLNDETVSGLIRATGNPKLAWDSYRRLIQSFAEVVYAAGGSGFDEAINDCLRHDGLKSISEINSAGLRTLCNEFKFIYRDCTGRDFPQDPWKQLHKAVKAVFDSWFSDRAVRYRSLNDINEETGTACLIQSMVFGNAGATSGAGVGFTRNPANGSNELYVDYLPNAQGEDIVSGRHDVHGMAALQQRYPVVFERLEQIKRQLESEFLDMQDFEFTVQDGELYMLQTRDGKRTPMAALRIAIDLYDEKMLDTGQALALLDGIDLDNLYQCRFRQTPAEEPVATGIPAGTGVAAGVMALDEAAAKRFSEAGKPVTLVRAVTSTDDIGAMHLADAIVTATGGRTSHAAVVARQLGTACVVGCHALKVDMANRRVCIDDQVLNEGDYLTVDADHGCVYRDRLELIEEKPEDLLQRIREWRATGIRAAGSVSK